MPLERKLASIVGILCLSALGLALVSQHVYGMMPCAWCALQRLIYFLIALLVAAPALFNLQRGIVRAVGGMVVALSLSGMAAAWYQTHFAAKAFSCDLSLADKIITKTGLDASLPWLFGILASCADAVVDILGLNYSTWSFSLFSLLGVLATVITFHKK